MKMNVTIARRYGSGGHDIGKLVADWLGIDFYDQYFTYGRSGGCNLQQCYKHWEKQHIIFPSGRNTLRKVFSFGNSRVY